MVMGEQTLETEVAIIGGGPGGYAAAFRAADLGLEVALINQEERLGGVCLLRGCIPAKVFLEVVNVIHDVRHIRDRGIQFGELDVDVDALRGWKDHIVDRLTSGLEKLADNRDVQLIQARATFESSNQIRLEGSDVAHVQFERAILATGSTPIPLPGVEFKAGGRVMDSTGALSLPDVPQRLLVVGGGYNGVELGSVYAALGSRVTLVELTDGLLPGVDRDLVRYLMRSVKDSFETMYFNTEVASLEEREDHVVVTLEGEVDEPERTFDRVLVFIGRRPNSRDIGLENTQIEVDDKGFVIVDEERRTKDEHIFAIGDVVGPPLLAHKAMHEGKIAAEVIAGEPAAFDVRCIPSVIYTDPQIAWCGLMEDADLDRASADVDRASADVDRASEAEEADFDVQIGRFPWGASGRALTMGAAEGLTKMIFDAETERVLGVGIVGRGAEDLIAEGALAVEMGALAEDLALTIHPHPSLSETESEAAEAFLGLSTHVLPRGKK